MNLTVRSPFWLAVVFLGALCSPFVAAISDDREESATRQELFDEIDGLFEQAREFDVLSIAPESLAEAHEAYTKALEQHRRGRSFRTIRKHLEDARKHLDAGIEAARICGIVLEDLVAMRSEAIELGIAEMEPKLFEQAEDRFLKATRQLGRGNRDRAKKYAPDAAKAYRKAVTEALLAGPLAEAEALLKENRKNLGRQERRTCESDLKTIKSQIRSDAQSDFAVKTYWTATELQISAAMRSLLRSIRENLPQYLEMGGFRLEVIEYTDVTSGKLSGKAAGYFYTQPCGASTLSPFGTIPTYSQVSFPVQFQDVEIAHWPPKGNTERVVRGKIDQTLKPPVVCDIDDFDLQVNRIKLEPKSAQAEVALRFAPQVLMNASRCTPAAIGPFTVPIDSTGNIKASLPRYELDSLYVGNTGLLIEAHGVEIDLTATPRTVTLKEGRTLAPKAYASNTGYLFGQYEFTKATVIGCGGFNAGLDLKCPLTFASLLPSGFNIELKAGELILKNSGVSTGSFKGSVVLPGSVTDDNGNALTAGFTAAKVDSTLAFFGDVALDRKHGVWWGGFSLAAAEGRLFLPASTGAFTASPLTPVAGKTYSALDRTKLNVSLATLPGLTVNFLIPKPGDEFSAYSPDAKNRIRYDLEKTQLCGWLNIASRGVTGELRSMEWGKLMDLALGKTGEKGYKAKHSFAGTVRHEPDSLQWVDFRFVRNAVSDAYTGGRLDIPYPSGFVANYRDLETTSTAELIGGDVFFTEKELKYWGVRMTAEKSGNVLSVDTGEIIYMNSSIAEKVHFTRPLGIIWGEMLAGGNLGRFVFDLNSAGQQFDGIPFTLHAAALSEYKSGSPTSNALMGYLNAYGDVHFDFFGAKRVDVLDYKDDRGGHDKNPYYSRCVDLNEKRTELHFAKNWGSGTAKMVFDAVYDASDQNGFQGTNAVKPMEIDLQFLPTMTAGSLQPAIIDLNGGCSYIHFCVGGSVKTSSETLKLMDLDYASINQVGGLIQIKGDAVKRIVLEGHAALNSWSFEGNSLSSVDITPNTVTLRTRDHMSIACYSVGLMGLASTTLILNNKTASLEGDVSGVFQVYGGSNFAINQSAYAEIEARGRFNFYISPVTNYVQGYGKISAKFGITLECEGAFFAGHGAPTDKVWALDKITRGPSIREILKGQGRTTLSGIYLAGSFSYTARIAEVIEGGYSAWVGIGFFGPTIADQGKSIDMSTTFLAHAGVGVHGEVFEGLASASAWAELLTCQTMSLQTYPRICMQGTLGVKACVLIFCANWQGTISISDQGFETGGCYSGI